jgi:hypothetical protein
LTLARAQARGNVGQARILLIARRHDRRAGAPVQVQGGIAPQDPRLVAAVVVLVDLSDATAGLCMTSSHHLARSGGVVTAN